MFGREDNKEAYEYMDTMRDLIIKHHGEVTWLEHARPILKTVIDYMVEVPDESREACQDILLAFLRFMDKRAVSITVDGVTVPS